MRYAVAIHHGQIPDDNGAPIVADKAGIGITKVVEQGD